MDGTTASARPLAKCMISNGFCFLPICCALHTPAYLLVWAGSLVCPSLCLSGPPCPGHNGKFENWDHASSPSRSPLAR